jgi:hypothetical protein
MMAAVGQAHAIKRVFGWPTCCCAPCVASAWSKRTLPTPPVAAFVSSCLRSALWCSSASAGSKSGWHQPVPQLMSGDRPPVASPPHAPAARPPDTRRRIASLTRHHPEAHRDRFFAAPAAQNDSSTPRADGRHPEACQQHHKHGDRNIRSIAHWYGEIYGLAIREPLECSGIGQFAAIQANVIIIRGEVESDRFDQN